MKVIKKKVDDGKFQLDCIATKDEVARALHEAGIEFANELGVTPKQNGQTPNSAIEEKLGIKDADALLSARAKEFLVPVALNKAGILPLYPPTPLTTSDLKRGNDFGFSLRVTPKPDYDLKSYDPVEIKAQPKIYDYSQLDEQLKKMAEQYAGFVKAPDKPIEVGDTALIKIFATKDGEPLAALNADARPYTAGQGYMPEGFDKNVIGMQPGETKKFSFEAPDFDEDFNQITVNIDCTVEVVEIQTRQVEELSDDWVSRNMPMFKSLEDLKNTMRKDIEKQQDRQYDYYIRNLVVSEISHRFDGKIDDGAYEAASKSLKESMVKEAKANNMSWEQFVEANGGEQQMNMFLMLQTRQMLVQGFALDAVFRKKKLVVAEEDIMEGCVSLGADPRSYKQTQKYFEESGRDFVLREAAERARASRYLVEHAKISYIEPKEEIAEPAKAESNEEAQTEVENTEEA